MRGSISMQASVRSLPRSLLSVMICASALAAAGCDVPAQMVWSPDGRHAAYRSGEKAFLLDEKGSLERPLGASIGGFAWSADSSSLYFAVTSKDPGVATPLQMQWIEPAADAASQPATEPTTQAVIMPATTTASAPATDASATQPADQQEDTVVSVLNNGKSTALFELAGLFCWHLQLSPDGQWLAAMTDHEQNNGPGENRLFAFSMKSGRLYEISQFCGLGACFTGPNTLAFIQPDGLDDVGKFSGHIVEVKLDEASTTLLRHKLLDVIVPTTRWMEPCADGLMFTATPRAFPAASVPGAGTPLFKLFHFSRADHGLSVLADDVGELFDASPDGKRILFEKRTLAELPATTSTTVPTSEEADAETAQAAPMRDDLCVMNANGSDPHVLRSLDEYVGDPKPPMWPAWRGNDQITFTAPAENAQISQDDVNMKTLDVVQYRLTDKGTLTAMQTLSHDWAREMKPYLGVRGIK